MCSYIALIVPIYVAITIIFTIWMSLQQRFSSLPIVATAGNNWLNTMKAPNNQHKNTVLQCRDSNTMTRYIYTIETSYPKLVDSSKI